MQSSGGTDLPNGTQPPTYSTPPTYEESNVPAGSNQPPASANKWDIPASAPPATSEPPANTALPVNNNNAVQTTPQLGGKKQIMIGPIRIGVLILLVILLWVLLMEFCALCVSGKLTTVKSDAGFGITVTSHCGWDRFRTDMAGVSDKKWSDLDGDDAKKNKSAGQTFIAMGVLSFFLILAMITLVLNMEFGFIPIPTWYVNLGACFVLWIFMTCAWGAWADQNTCKDQDGYDSRHGDGLNLMITAWFFFTFFYIPASIPLLQKALFGPNACDPREQ